MFRVTKELLPTHHARLVVEFTPQAVERAQRRVARELSQRLHIPGFRPGKAPYGVVARFVGEETAREELVETLVHTHLQQILKQAGVKPATPPRLTEVTSWDPITVVLDVPLEPDIQLPEDNDLDVPYHPPQVSEEDIERALENLRRMHVRMETVERPAQMGDLVRFKLRVEVPLEDQGEPQVLMEEELILLVKEDDDPEEWPFPGFSKQLQGLQQGDSRTLTYTFPEDAEDETLRGRTATYHVEVLEVQTPVYPELTDEFIQENTEYTSLEELRQGLRENLAEDRKLQYEREYRQQVLEALVEKSQVTFPKIFVDAEVEERMRSLQEELQEQGLTLEEYLQELGKTEEELRADITQQARENLKRQLVLEALIEREEPEMDETGWRWVLERLAMMYYQETGQEIDVKTLRRLLRRDPHWQHHLQELMGAWLRNAALERLVQRLQQHHKAQEEEGQSDQEPQVEVQEMQASRESVASEETDTESQAEPPPSSSAAPEGQDQPVTQAVQPPFSTSPEGGEA